MKQASRKAAGSEQLWKDLSGMMSGLTLVARSDAQLPSQRAILTTRHVTKAQRETIERTQAIKAFEAQELADQARFEQEMIR